MDILIYLFLCQNPESCFIFFIKMFCVKLRIRASFARISSCKSPIHSSQSRIWASFARISFCKSPIHSSQSLIWASFAHISSCKSHTLTSVLRSFAHSAGVYASLAALALNHLFYLFCVSQTLCNYKNDDILLYFARNFSSNSLIFFVYIGNLPWVFMYSFYSWFLGAVFTYDFYVWFLLVVFYVRFLRMIFTCGFYLWFLLVGFYTRFCVFKLAAHCSFISF